MKFLLSFEICSTPKLPKHTTLFKFTYKATQRFPIDLSYIFISRFKTYALSFILGKLFLE